MLRSTFTFSAHSKQKVFRKYCIIMPGYQGLKGVGIFFVTKFYFTKIQSFALYLVKTRKYNVCGINLEMKEIRLQKKTC